MIAPLVVSTLIPLSQDSMAPVFGVASPAYVAIRAILTIALVGLLGILSLHLAVLPLACRSASIGTPVPNGVGERASLWWTRALLWTILATTLARLAAQHAAFFGTEESWSRSTLGALLLDSSWGRGWWLALAAITVGLWGEYRIRHVRAFGWQALTVAAVALALSIAMSGHAAVSPTATVIHTLHVIGAGGWIGSLAAVMLIAIPAVLRSSGDNRHGQIAAVMRGFSAPALGFAGLLTVTGTIAAWRNIGAVAELVHSLYGQVLLVKLALLSVAAGTGAYNWKRVLPSLGSGASSTARLRRSAAVELVAALAVLIVTAVLVATPMPGDP
ncbi:MAG: CopD family protein [Gemmatimonadaceae bacterium]|jgi:putative copper export protein